MPVVTAHCWLPMSTTPFASLGVTLACQAVSVDGEHWATGNIGGSGIHLMRTESHE